MTSTSNTYVNEDSDQEQVARKILYSMYSELLQLRIPHSEIKLMRRIVFYQNNHMSKKEKLLLLNFLNKIHKGFVKHYESKGVLHHFFFLKIKNIVEKTIGRRLFQKIFWISHNLFIKLQ